MKKSVSKLRPKANKLLSLVTNWRFYEPSDRTALAESLSQLLEKERFPSPIESFFKIPQFQQFLVQLEKGKLYDKEENSNSYLPKAIYNLQLLNRAFHKLVHLDYGRDRIDEPFIQAKITAQNISDYAKCAALFIGYEGKIVDEILSYLFDEISTFAKDFKDLSKSEELNSKIKELVQRPFFENLLSLDKRSFHPTLIDEISELLIELNVNPQIEKELAKLESLVLSNALKIINQMKTILEKCSEEYERLNPTYFPSEIRESVLAEFEEIDPDKKISGQKINDLFVKILSEEKYILLEAREHGDFDKLQTLISKFWSTKRSLFSLLDQHSQFLPRSFVQYVEDVIKPISEKATILGTPKTLGSQFLLGFFTMQYDYLSELLFQSPICANYMPITNSIERVLPKALSFLERYYSISL